MQFEWWELRIILVGVLIAISCSLLSVYIVLRRMAMISEGVSHAGFGGMGIALLLGVFIPLFANTYVEQVMTGVFCLGTALAIGFITKNRHVSHDSAIGIFLVAAVALGMLFISIYRSFGRGAAPNLESILFGQFTAVNNVDLLMAGAGVAVVCTLVTLLFHELLYTTLDQDMARVNGVNVRFINTLLLVLVSLVIVVGVRMVGFLMITAMTIIPGATANMLSRRFGGVLAASLTIGAATSFVSLLLAVKGPLSNFAPGPILVLTMFAVFIVVWLIRHTARPKLGND